MKKAFAQLATGVIAVACLPSSADASWFSWFGRRNAEELPHFQQLLPYATGNIAAAEAPATTPPAVLEDRQASDNSTNTCGYVDGYSNTSLFCGIGYACVPRSSSWMGCCPTQSENCPVPTICIPQSESDLYASLGTSVPTGTLECFGNDYPECITYIYADTSIGYSIVGCGSGFTNHIQPLYHTPTPVPQYSTTTPITSPSPSPPPVVSTTPIPVPTPPPPPPPTPTPPPTNGTNIGAIVGGVVGGVAVLGLLGLGAFCLARRKSNKNDNSANNAEPPAGPQQQPPVAEVNQDPYFGGPASPQPGYAGGFAPAAGAAAAGGLAGGGVGAAAAYQHHEQQHDSKAADAYGSQYDPARNSVLSAGASPGSSPVPPYSPNSAYGVFPNNAPPPDAHELPTERGDGELRELS